MAKEKAVCKTCGKEFLYYRSTLRGQDGKHCSTWSTKVNLTVGKIPTEDKKV